MAAGLPNGAIGAAVFSMVYAVVSLCCSAMLAWLTWAHREGSSHVALVTGFAAFSTIASIIQQVHDIAFYREVVTEQFARRKPYRENPDVALANGSYGMDLVLYFMQYYSYNVMTMMVMFWAWELAQTVYGLGTNPRQRRMLRKFNTAGKLVAVLFPLLAVLLLRVQAIRTEFVLFMLIADLPLAITLAVGGATMLAITIRYMQSRTKFTRWQPPGQASSAVSNGSGSAQSGTGPNRKRASATRGLYDRWLMVRFSIAFAVLVLFEVTNALFQISSVNNNRADLARTQPDLGAARARSTFFLFLPGNTPGIFLLIVFGTTTGCRKVLYETFVPRAWREGASRRLERPLSAAFSLKHIVSFEGIVVNQEEDTARRLAQAQTQMGGAFYPNTAKPATTPPCGLDTKTTPFPTAAPLSRFNRGWNDGRTSRTANPQSHLDPAIGTAQNIYSSSSTRSHPMDSIRHDYYQPSTEESDESGPVLPIMRGSCSVEQELRVELRAPGPVWPSGGGKWDRGR